MKTSYPVGARCQFGPHLGTITGVRADLHAYRIRLDDGRELSVHEQAVRLGEPQPAAAPPVHKMVEGPRSPRGPARKGGRDDGTT